jgi:nitrate/TMAO reductase-like tetraheme cytochrome c subunit
MASERAIELQKMVRSLHGKSNNMGPGLMSAKKKMTKTDFHMMEARKAKKLKKNKTNSKNSKDERKDIVDQIDTILSATEDGDDAEAAHKKLFAENRFPSAATCASCHPKQYKEWSVSQHSYSQLSPVYLTLSNKINVLSNGSNGDFCLRCHSQVGANLGESSMISNLDRHPTSREGITCVVCHRMDKDYNKASGRLALVEGPLSDPIYGPSGNAEVARILKNPQEYSVVTSSDQVGRVIHKEVKKFSSLSNPVMCGSCHDVTLFNGFRLEEAYSEYKTSPAAAKGVTCQDCHMGKVQGKVSGYEHGPAAMIGGKPTKSRKLTNHIFAGPDYSVIHPGIFPHNTRAQELATIASWLQFDYKAGWGTDEFEDNVKSNYPFPEAWESIDDRYEAMEIIEEQLEKLAWVKSKRIEVLKNGYLLKDIIVTDANDDGIKFKVKVANGTDGHNVPTGFTGERLVWLDVTVTDQNGNIVLRSGDGDPNGDLRDLHSSYVHNGEIELDEQLFNLQSRFVTQNGRGGEIEHVIPIPYPVISLPRVIPSTTSLIFTGEPATERVDRRGIGPNGHRWAHYHVDGDKLTGKGPYKLVVKLNNMMAPPNLIAAMQDVGFDYGMSPREIVNNVAAGMVTLWKKTLTIKMK